MSENMYKIARGSCVSISIASISRQLCNDVEIGDFHRNSTAIRCGTIDKLIHHKLSYIYSLLV